MARPESEFWQYKFVIDGRFFRGSTGCIEASEAAKIVDIKRAEARQQIQAEANAIGHVSAGSRELTLAQCLERYRAAKEAEWRNKQCRRVNAEYCLSIGDGPNMLVSQITLQDLLTFRARRKLMRNRKGEPVKDTTINRDLAHLRASIRYAGKCGFLVPQIDWSVAIKNKAEKHRTRTLSEAEQAKLFAAIQKLHPDLEGPVRFAILSAARKTAVFDLAWEDVDFGEEVAFIHLKGEGSEPIVHEIPLTKAMVELLKNQPSTEGCNRVFTYLCRKTNRATGQVKGRRYPWTEHGIYKPWNAVVKEAGLRDFRFHDLRHTGATRLVRAVPNLEIARQLLGHADIKTTQKYANINREDVRAAMELVSEPKISVIEGGKSG